MMAYRHITKHIKQSQNMWFLALYLLVFIGEHRTFACRSSVDEDRVPVMSHHVSILILYHTLI